MAKIKIRITSFRSKPAIRIRLPYPITSKLRPAQVSPAPRFEGVQPFTPKRWLELEGYRPRVLIGSAADLQSLAEQVELGILGLPSVDHAIIVLTHYGAKPLSDVLRVTLWQCFGVPIYELYLGPNNALLASECEAHEGWHVEDGVQFGLLNEELVLDSPGNFGLRTGLTGSLEDTTCPCSRTTCRLLDVEALSRVYPPKSMAISA